MDYYTSLESCSAIRCFFVLPRVASLCREPAFAIGPQFSVGLGTKRGMLRSLALLTEPATRDQFALSFGSFARMAAPGVSAYFSEFLIGCSFTQQRMMSQMTSIGASVFTPSADAWLIDTR